MQQGSRLDEQKSKRQTQDAQLLLTLLLEGRFPRIWVPNPENRDLRDADPMRIQLREGAVWRCAEAVRAAVRHRAIARSTLMCFQRSQWWFRSMNTSPAARRISATSKGGRRIYWSLS